MFKRRQPRHRAPLTTAQQIKHNSPTLILATAVAGGVATPAHGILLGKEDTGTLPIQSAEPTFAELVNPEPPFHKLVSPAPIPHVHKTIAEKKRVVHNARHIRIRRHTPKPIAHTQEKKAPQLKHVSHPTPTSGVAVGKWATVLSALRSQLGVPYVYGGETPGRGFDCSGLTQWAFAKVGIHLPRTAEAQSGAGYAVRSPKPGDLVAYGGHVGVYIGSGNMIAAPHTGDVVKIQSVYGAPQYRRIL